MKYSVIILLASLLGACKTAPVTSGIELRENPQGTMQLLVNNPKLGEKLTITSSKTRQQNNLLQAAVTLKSQYKKSQKLQYQFVWYDAQGFTLHQNQSPWRALDLTGFEQRQLTGLAPNQNAVTFALAVREVSTQAQEFKE